VRLIRRVENLQHTDLFNARSISCLFPEHSFRAPFSSADYDGSRSVEHWVSEGTTDPKKHFVRLTPDRQSKVGSLWNSAPLLLEGFSITLRFRISGQGKKYFGDGLSLWVTTSRRFEAPGPAQVGFTGFGVTLDTFKNEEHGHLHRDVLFLTSAKGPPTIDGSPVGCDSDYRYWEGLHDFSARNYSGLRVSFRDNHVSLFMDPRGTENWVECFSRARVAASLDWWRSGIYLGLSASTGDLADNHDVLSLVTTLEDEPAPLLGVVHDAPAQVQRNYMHGGSAPVFFLFGIFTV
jgi:lectin, mannose-binding 2